MRIFKKILIILLWYPLRVFIKASPLYLTYLLGLVGGHLLYLLSREKQNIMAKELGLIMPDKSIAEIKEIVKGSFKNYCLSEIEVLLYPDLNSRYIEKNVIIKGKEYLDKALLRGKGVLLFQAHFGAFQMIMPSIGYSGYKMSQISASASIWKDNKATDIQGKIFDIKANHEYSLPVHHISVRSSLRPAFRALANNEIVGITVDGGGGKKIVPVKFLKREANFQQGGATMASMTDAAIVPAFIITEKGLKHRLIIHPPIKVDDKFNKKERIEHIMQEFAGILEKYVYKYPTHYGYSLYLRRERACLDPYPFFQDHYGIRNMEQTDGKKGINYA